MTNAATDHAQPEPQKIPDEVLQTLGVKWLESFTTAARSQDRLGVMRLFSEKSLICGSQKDGPLDNVLCKNFHFELDSAKMIPHSPCVLVVCSWHAVSQVHGGPTRIGDATFFIGAEPTETGQRFVAYHAHFSMQ